jgi:hypothetical protein
MNLKLGSTDAEKVIRAGIARSLRIQRVSEYLGTTQTFKKDGDGVWREEGRTVRLDKLLDRTGMHVEVPDREES